MRQLHANLRSMSPIQTDKNPNLLQEAELIVAKQTVEDYRTRLHKLGQFFVHNSKQYRTVVQDIFGWKYAIQTLDYTPIMNDTAHDLSTVCCLQCCDEEASWPQMHGHGH